MALLLGADVGTSSLKVVLFDEDLHTVGQVRQEYATRYPEPSYAEQDAEDWFSAFCAATHHVLAASGVQPNDIAAVGIDGMSSLALPVDVEGKPLRPAMIWLDRRARAEAERGRSELEASQLAINGNRCDPSCFAPKMAWIRDHEPEVYRRAACFLHCNAFLVQRLTGAFTMDVSEAGLSLVCDIRTGQYSDELVRAWGLDRRKLPEVFDCTELAGRITPAAAAATGLAAGTPVVAGAMDNVAATVGLGLCEDGDAYIAAGTVTNVGVMRDRPVPEGKGLLYHSAVKGRWLVNGGADYGGAGMLWFRNLLDNTDLGALGELAAATPCGEHPLVFLPYMAGQRAPLWNDSASGVVLGITPATERRHLARMFMESVALAARHVFETLCPERPTCAALTGGITHNRAWSQVMADVTGMRLSLCEQVEVSTLGAAVLAGVGAGIFPSVTGALARIPVGPVLEPDSMRVEYYSALYDIFSQAYSSITGPLSALDQLRRGSCQGPGSDAGGDRGFIVCNVAGSAVTERRKNMMKALVLHAPGVVRVEEVPTPIPGPGEVLLRVERCGVCGSDVPRFIGNAAHRYPIVLGHEFSGTVEAVGEGVSSGLIGRRAACAPLLPNFSDPQCARGNYSLGQGYGFIGSRQPGGFAEYVAIPSRNAILLDDGVDFTTGSFLEPLTVGLHAIQSTDFRSGRSVAVMGVGTIGLLLVQSLRALGAGPINAFDVEPVRLEQARALGADRTHDSRQEGVDHAAFEALRRTGFEFVFETAGVPAAEILALRLAAPRGHVMYVGTPQVALTLQPQEFELLNRKELVVQGSWMNYSAPFPGWEWEIGTQLLKSGRVRTEMLVDRVLPLARGEDIPDLLRRRGELKGKLILDCAAA